jgi:hypothetical protein
MGFDDAYVPHVRRMFLRDHTEFTRPGNWEPGPGGW